MQTDQQTSVQQSRLASALVGLALMLVMVSASAAPAPPPNPFAEYEKAGMRFGEIRIQRDPIFDTSQPKENKRLYRAANRIHILTRESVLRGQLLIASGELVDAQAVEETERVLRRNNYIYDVTITPTKVAEGVVDVLIVTRDNWTLFPQIGFSQQGGQTEYALGLRESNLFGTGASLGFRIEDDGDRESSLLQYNNRNVRGTWWRFEVGYRDSDDGDGQRLRIIRPFFSLDTKYSAGLDATAVVQEEPLFSFGDEIAEYQRDQLSVNLWYGWSKGLQEGWTRRWQLGFRIDDNRFEEVVEPLRLLVRPDDRDLRYPYVRYEAIENRFKTVTNVSRIAVTEDLFLGTRYSAALGWFGASTGADRDGAVFDLDYLTTRGDPERWLWRWRAMSCGRIETGELKNGRFTLESEFVRRQSPTRQWAIKLESTVAHEPDLDQPVLLGGLTGLRGYDRAFGNGDARALLTLEQRGITDWYPFRLFRVGGAAFVDVGRVWGNDVAGLSTDKLLTNVGVGLRLMSTRASSNRMLHIDFAWPTTRDVTIDSGLQVSIQGKRGF
ncbi:MAG: hypothetical protein AAGJ86_09055 [Pseudomonadota bacterium]